MSENGRSKIYKCILIDFLDPFFIRIIRPSRRPNPNLLPVNSKVFRMLGFGGAICSYIIVHIDPEKFDFTHFTSQNPAILKLSSFKNEAFLKKSIYFSEDVS